MAGNVRVRAGYASTGEYSINTKKGLLQRTFEPPIDLLGANVQLLSSDPALNDMARNGLVGGLLLGGAGVALGVLASREDLVMFELRWRDGRILLAESTPSAYRDVLVAQHEADQRGRAQARSRQHVGQYKAVVPGQSPAKGRHGLFYVACVVGTASALIFALSGVIANAPSLAYWLGALVLITSILALKGPPLLRRIIVSHRGIVGLALAVALAGSLSGLQRAESNTAERAAEARMAAKNAAEKLAEERRRMASEAARQDHLRARSVVDLVPMKELSNKLNSTISTAKWEEAWRLLDRLDALSQPYMTAVGLPQDAAAIVAKARSSVSFARGVLQARATIARTTRLLLEGQQLQRASDREGLFRAIRNFSQIIHELKALPPAYAGYVPELAAQLARAEKLDGQARDRFARRYKLLLGSGSSHNALSASSSGSSGEQLTVPLSDGSVLTFSNLRHLPDWACGTRRGALFRGTEVVLYFDRSGMLVSANIPAAGNQKFYETDPSVSCVKNWMSGAFEMLTDSEYKWYDEESRRKSR